MTAAAEPMGHNAHRNMQPPKAALVLGTFVGCEQQGLEVQRLGQPQHAGASAYSRSVCAGLNCLVHSALQLVHCLAGTVTCISCHFVFLKPTCFFLWCLAGYAFPSVRACHQLVHALLLACKHCTSCCVDSVCMHASAGDLCSHKLPQHNTNPTYMHGPALPRRARAA